jgi:hypothetical protein
MKEDRPPKIETIDRWCSQAWSYKGAFIDDSALPLDARWQSCRSFLERKGFTNTAANWLQNIPEPMREMLARQYRGEMLELEILPFCEVSFAELFSAPDPIATKLPVEELIFRVRERFAPPSNTQLRARILMAAAFQRAFTKSVTFLGTAPTLKLLGWFRELHLHFMDLHNRANPETKERILELLRQQYSWGNDLRDATEWLFNEAGWEKLTAELAARFLEDSCWL